MANAQLIANTQKLLNQESASLLFDHKDVAEVDYTRDAKRIRGAYVEIRHLKLGEFHHNVIYIDPTNHGIPSNYLTSTTQQYIEFQFPAAEFLKMQNRGGLMLEMVVRNNGNAKSWFQLNPMSTWFDPAGGVELYENNQRIWRSSGAQQTFNPFLYQSSNELSQYIADLGADTNLELGNFPIVYGGTQRTYRMQITMPWSDTGDWLGKSGRVVDAGTALTLRLYSNPLTAVYASSANLLNTTAAQIGGVAVTNLNTAAGHNYFTTANGTPTFDIVTSTTRLVCICETLDAHSRDQEFAVWNSRIWRTQEWYSNDDNIYNNIQTGVATPKIKMTNLDKYRTAFFMFAIRGGRNFNDTNGTFEVQRLQTKIAAGTTQATTGGNFRVTFNGYTTAVMAHNVTNDLFATALNALPSITALYQQVFVIEDAGFSTNGIVDIVFFNKKPVASLNGASGSANRFILIPDVGLASIGGSTIAYVADVLQAGAYPTDHWLNLQTISDSCTLNYYTLAGLKVLSDYDINVGFLRKHVLRKMAGRRDFNFLYNNPEFLFIPFDPDFIASYLFEQSQGLYQIDKDEYFVFDLNHGLANGNYYFDIYIVQPAWYQWKMGGLPSEQNRKMKVLKRGGVGNELIE